MSKKKYLLQSALRKMFKYHGPLHWWPASSPFEVMVGAILTQNTAWGNVEKAILNLKKENLLDPKKLLTLRPSRLARLIRPAGYFRVKTKRLKNFLKFLMVECEGDLSRLRRQPLTDLRKKLLSVNGIGPETADSILLYALGKPVFVIDAYTKRILERHYLAKKGATYEELQKFFMSHLKPDPSLYNEYHAQLVLIGKHFCKTKPRCEGCPLNGLNW